MTISLCETSVYSVPARLPQPCTVRHLVESHLDIAAVPRRSFFELLSTFSTNELEHEKLVEFSSAAGQDELHSYCNRPRRTALEVRLNDGLQFKPVKGKITLYSALIVTLIPPLMTLLLIYFKGPVCRIFMSFYYLYFESIHVFLSLFFCFSITQTFSNSTPF